MKINIKKFLVVFTISTVLLWFVSIIIGYSLVFNIQNYKHIKGIVLAGDTIRPLSDFDFAKGDWKAYLYISRDDFNDLHPSIKKVNCLKTSDKVLLEKMKHTWSFVYKGGDMATVTSYINIYKNGFLFFSSGIVLDKSTEGLQGEYGWMKPIQGNALIETCKDFERVYVPIVFL